MLILNKDDLEFVIQFSCLLEHLVYTVQSPMIALY